MSKISKRSNSLKNEVIFQIALHVLVFLFYSFDRNDPQIQISQVLFFLNYAGAGLVLNYIVFPKYFYSKKYLPLVIYTIITIAIIIVLEELVLEKIYFPDTKGKSFPGVIYSLVDVLPVITILSGFKFAWDSIRKQREVNALKTAVKESELQFLKSQINPHFLFNNLNNLYSYAIEESSKTPEIILELSDILRYMLYECKARYVPMMKEIIHLENFINLSNLQIEERGQVSFSKGEIGDGYDIAPLILIVFIENAFKHSTASQSENININVFVEISEEGMLNFVCKNSFSDEFNTDSLATGIGLENVRKRLELLYPQAHTLNISKTDHEFHVDLTMDLKKHVEE